MLQLSIVSSLGNTWLDCENTVMAKNLYFSLRKDGGKIKESRLASRFWVG